MRQELRFGKAEEAELEAVLSFDAVVGGALPERVLGWPGRRVDAPDEGKVLEDQSSAREMARGAYDFR